MTKVSTRKVVQLSRFFELHGDSSEDAGYMVWPIFLVWEYQALSVEKKKRYVSLRLLTSYRTKRGNCAANCKKNINEKGCG